ncbi:MAG: hypothetical protein Q8N31_02375 [Reyranella sp.]|nr:hypothetical protein [Reyranella sp.]
MSKVMSLYEALALVALAAVGGFAYHLYRSDMRARPPGAQQAEGTEIEPDRLMFGRDKPGSGSPPKR